MIPNKTILSRRFSRQFLALGVLSLSLMLSAQDGGFQKLFNGENLDGWTLKIRKGDQVTAHKVFQVEDGVIHVYADFPDGDGTLEGRGNTHAMMYTEKSYQYYVFRFEYKWGKKQFNNFDRFQYDAGVYYHVYDDSIWPKGIEYQIRYDHTKDRNHTGDFWASSTSFQWFSAGVEGETFVAPWKGGQPQAIKSGEHRASIDANVHKLDGQWNQCEIIVMGDQFALHKLNGKVVNYATELSVDSGVIGLQAETAELFYRNVELKVFKQAQPLRKFLN